MNHLYPEMRVLPPSVVLPAQELRRNAATWGVAALQMPAIGSVMHDLAPNEIYDPRFLGQDLSTYYFDTPGRDLTRARRKGNRYLTLRLRHYQPCDGSPDAWSLSAKTENGKWRIPLDEDSARAIQQNLLPAWPRIWLPGDLLARLQELAPDPDSLVVCIRICCRRYAVEDAINRYTLDVGLQTDLGRMMSHGVLEFKSNADQPMVPMMVTRLQLRPIRLSKFKWATW